MSNEEKEKPPATEAKRPPEKPEVKPQVVALASLSDFQAKFKKRFTWEFTYDGQAMTIEYEQIPPKVQVELDRIFQRIQRSALRSTEVMPPIKKTSKKVPKKKTIDKDGNEVVEEYEDKLVEEYDLEDLVYNQKLDEKFTEVRALTLYHTVPIFRDAKPGLTDRQEILEHVYAQGNLYVLEGLYNQVVQHSGLSAAEMVNFISGNSQES